MESRFLSGNDFVNDFARIEPVIRIGMRRVLRINQVQGMLSS